MKHSAPFKIFLFWSSLQDKHKWIKHFSIRCPPTTPQSFFWWGLLPDHVSFIFPEYTKKRKLKFHTSTYLSDLLISGTCTHVQCDFYYPIPSVSTLLLLISLALFYFSCFLAHSPSQHTQQLLLQYKSLCRLSVLKHRWRCTPRMPPLSMGDLASEL